MSFLFVPNHSAEIAKKQSKLNDQKEQVEEQKKVLKMILDLKRKHKAKLPYKLISSLDLEAVENHFHKVSHKKEMAKAALTIQSCFRFVRLYQKLCKKFRFIEDTRQGKITKDTSQIKSCGQCSCKECGDRTTPAWFANARLKKTHFKR